MKNQKGITLIALIITIIVMLILAGVSISMLTGENGVLTRAERAVEEQRAAEEKESLYLDTMANTIDEYTKDDDQTKVNKIPDGGIYYVGVTSTSTGNYTGSTATYTAGEEFPESVAVGDVYKYGDYEYRYGRRYNSFGGWLNSSEECTDGWGVRVLDNTKTSYGEILTTINDANVESLRYTFGGCVNLLDNDLPNIPSTVVEADYAFQSCKSLVNLSSYTIPGTVKRVTFLFQNCTALEYGPILCEGTTNFSDAFADCVSLKVMPQLPSTVPTSHYSSIFSGCTLLGY